MPVRIDTSVSVRTVFDKVGLVTDTHLIQGDDRAVA